MIGKAWRGLVGLASVAGVLGVLALLLALAPGWAGACAPSDTLCRYLTGVAPSVLLNLQMALASIGVGVAIGFLVGWARVAPFVVLRHVARGYTELIRGTPLLIQIFIVFFLFPSLNIYFGQTGIGLRFDVPEIQRVIIALTVNTSAYQGEIFRAGFQSIAAGQLEAARSIGMTSWQAMQHIVIPQALRTIAPPLTNEYIIMFKDATPLAFIVAGSAVPELVQQSRAFSQATQVILGSFLLAAAVFLVLSLLLTLFLRLLERHFAVPGLGISVRAGE